MIHENSLISYIEEKELGRIGQRQLKVLEEIKHNPLITAREIKDSLGFSEMNAVRPRINELKKMDLIIEGEKVKCKITNKLVSTFIIKSMERYNKVKNDRL